MAWWMIILIALGGLVLAGVLLYAVERIGARAREISDAGGDTAPGWILRCTSCQAWRPATEAGVVRLGAASKGKRTYSRCTACGKLTFIAVERGPGAPGKRRIDTRTNESIWPETLANV
ncbi:MAG: hypothetical protein AAFO89_02615 [Planctomycetota bacterium]